MPPIGGLLLEPGNAEKTRQRHARFRQCNKTILESDEMSEVEKMQPLMECLQDYERTKAISGPKS